MSGARSDTCTLAFLELASLLGAIERALDEKKEKTARELYHSCQPLITKITTTCRESELNAAELQDLLRVAQKAQAVAESKPL